MGLIGGERDARRGREVLVLRGLSGGVDVLSNLVPQVQFLGLSLNRVMFSKVDSHLKAAVHQSL